MSKGVSIYPAITPMIQIDLELPRTFGLLRNLLGINWSMSPADISLTLSVNGPCKRNTSQDQINLVQQYFHGCLRLPTV